MQKKKKKEYTLLISEALNNDLAKHVKTSKTIYSSVNEAPTTQENYEGTDSYLTTKSDSAPSKASSVLQTTPRKSFIYALNTKDPGMKVVKLLFIYVIVSVRLRTSSSAPIPATPPLTVPVAASPVFLLNSPSPSRGIEYSMLFGVEHSDRDKKEKVKKHKHVNSEISIEVDSELLFGGAKFSPPIRVDSNEAEATAEALRFNQCG